MPRIIFKCPFIPPEQRRGAAHRENYVRYVATREGVERFDPGRTALPATEKQKKLVSQLLRDFPLCRGLFEYQDYPCISPISVPPYTDFGQLLIIS